ncbi:MAG: flagellar basal-body rod protein FlgG [Magnetococcales bacterium]|nr:flagellar basal-body rod protein FlgG [Magnetococcales bacterium]
MIRSLWTSASGMHAQQLSIDVIANNLANVSTTGFKHSRTNFQDLLYQNLREVGSETSQAGTIVPVGVQVGHGVKAAAVGKDFTQGSPVSTSQDPFNVDMMILGQGFFQIQLPNGDTAYTRDGSFKIDKEGNIVTSDGYPLIGGQIGLNPTTHTGVAVGEDGSVSLVTNAAGTNVTVAGQIELARFVNPAGLVAMGNNLFKESVSSGTATTGNPNDAGFGSLKQHYLEQSNVSMVTEMVDMITTQRAYEMASKGIRTADDMMGLVASLKR